MLYCGDDKLVDWVYCADLCCVKLTQNTVVNLSRITFTTDGGLAELSLQLNVIIVSLSFIAI